MLVGSRHDRGRGEQRGRRSHARRNHERLVAAAREVFAEQGVDASLEAIARRAGVGIGTLYRHFPTREALVEAIFERRIGALVAVADDAAAELRRLDRVRGLRRAHARAAGRRPRAQGDPRCAIRCSPAGSRARRQELRRHVERMLARAQAEGGLRADFTFADLALLLWSFAPSSTPPPASRRTPGAATCTCCSTGCARARRPRTTSRRCPTTSCRPRCARCASAPGRGGRRCSSRRSGCARPTGR